MVELVLPGAPETVTPQVGGHADDAQIDAAVAALLGNPAAVEGALALLASSTHPRALEVSGTLKTVLASQQVAPVTPDAAAVAAATPDATLAAAATDKAAAGAVVTPTGAGAAAATDAGIASAAVDGNTAIAAALSAAPVDKNDAVNAILAKQGFKPQATEGGMALGGSPKTTAA